MKNLNYSLFGLGTIARIHLLAIKSIPIVYKREEVFNVTLKSLFTTHVNEKLNIAQAIGFQEVSKELESIVGDPSINVVDICTPNYQHFEQALKSIENSKNVYCEKPLTSDIEEANFLVKVLKSKDVINQVALVLRFLPAVAQAHSILKSGIIGDANSFHFEMLHSSYLNPLKPMSWRLDKEKSGGGSILDLGIHLIDIVRFLIGEIEDVSALTGITVKERRLENQQELVKVNVDDWAYVIASTREGVKGVLESSRVAVGNEGTHLRIYCTSGSIKIDLDNPYNAIVFDSQGRQIYFNESSFLEDDFFCKVKEIYPDPKLSMGTMVDLHYSSLVWFFENVFKEEAIGGTPTFEEAYKDQLVIDAIYRSAKNNGELTKVYTSY
jgi:predicted dehydrogenase